MPVWNGLTTEFHPTQMIADMLTIEENFPEGLNHQKLVFFGDARNNMGNSLMVACAKLGLHFVAAAPQVRWPEQSLVEICTDIARENGGSVTLTEDPHAAAKDAHVLYTDIWLSMGDPAEEWEQRIQEMSAYRVTTELMDAAREDAIFMHCLPAFHDTKTTVGADIAKRFGITQMEVEDAVFESKRSRVFDEAENRMHSIKAIMYATLK